MIAITDLRDCLEQAKLWVKEQCTDVLFNWNPDATYYIEVHPYVTTNFKTYVEDAEFIWSVSVEEDFEFDKDYWDKFFIELNKTMKDWQGAVHEGRKGKGDDGPTVYLAGFSVRVFKDGNGQYEHVWWSCDEYKKNKRFNGNIDVIEADDLSEE